MNSVKKNKKTWSIYFRNITNFALYNQKDVALLLYLLLLLIQVTNLQECRNHSSMNRIHTLDPSHLHEESNSR